MGCSVILISGFPGFGEMVFDGEQELLEHVNVYVNNHEITSLEGPETKVADGDEMAVIPAIAGGAVGRGHDAGNG